MTTHTSLRSRRRLHSTYLFAATLVVACLVGGGRASAASEMPAPLVPPTLSGIARDGATLSAAPGVWSGQIPLAFAYSWQRCDGAGRSCVTISGATAASYTIPAAASGATFRVAVTATSAAGSATSHSAVSGIVAPSGQSPASSILPVVSGTIQEGHTLAATSGTWDGALPLAFTYQWQRCTPSGDSCTAIPGATALGYGVAALDVGSRIRVAVTATNTAGVNKAFSALTAAVVPADAPAIATRPSISGSAEEGGVLTVSHGSWAGAAPMSFAVEWWRCDSSGGICSTIPGATAETYSPVAADAAHSLRAWVTATNGAGTATALSTPSDVVAGTAPGSPVSTAPPAISGTPAVGEKLTASSGTWTGTNPLTFAYMWQLCDTGGKDCNAIPGATSTTYTPQVGDLGHTLRVLVVATNTSGSAGETSAPATVLKPRKPYVVALPVIYASSTTFKKGDVVTASTGSWLGASTIYYSFNWVRCKTRTFSTCTPIPGATTKLYTISAKDVGKHLLVQVRAHNDSGVSFADSQITPADVSLKLRNAVPPSISGTPAIGSKLTADPGTWTGAGPITYRYQWTRCTPNGSSCLPVPGAKGLTYVVTRADVGQQLFVQVKASARRTSLFANSARLKAITATPASTTLQISNVSLPDRLVISGVSFEPGSISSLAPFTARFRVTARSGRPVEGALVYALGIPYGWVMGAHEVVTDSSGWATVTITPTARLPLERGRALVMFVRARKPGENLLGGVSTRRLVQIVVRPRVLQSIDVSTAPYRTASTPIGSVSLPNRLVISGVKFEPSRIQSRVPFVARFRVTNRSGKPVQGALVYALGLPYSWVMPSSEFVTDANGWATVTITPTARLPLERDRALVMFVRARKPGENLLGGVSTRRLVQIRIG